MAEDHFNRIFKISKETKEPEQRSVPLRDWLKARLEHFLGHLDIDSQVQFPDFAELVLKCIYQILQNDPSLEISDAYPSRNKDHVLFDIAASEQVLKQEAVRVSYRLQFRHFSEEEESYQSIPPYVVYRADPDIERQLKSYNGSLFNNVDRIRLIASILDYKIERSELYSLGILRSEEYLCSKYGKEDNDAIIQEEKRTSCHLLRKFFRFADDQLRITFGERTALLYSWLSFYYLWWMLPGVIGFAMFVFDFILDYVRENCLMGHRYTGVEKHASPVSLAFAVFICIYSSLVVALWIRKEKTLAWHWGMTDISGIEVQRPQFIGPWMKDKVTGQMRKGRQSEFLIIFKRAASFLFILILLAFDISILALIFAYKSTLNSSWKQFWGALLNAIQVQVMGFLYRFMAKRMNDWENIEFETNYYNALCTKLFLFQFVNSYASLFYIAFVKGSIEGCIDDNCLFELNIQFLTIFGVFCAINLFKIIFSVCYPKITRYFELKRYNQQLIGSGQPPKSSLHMTKAESQFTLMRHHESPLHNHMDFVILYGYVLMFAVYFPLASFLLAVTGICDMFIRLAKQLYLLNQPFPYYAKNLGVWNNIILFINVIAAFTNPAIVIFTAKRFDTSTTNDVWIIYMSISFGLLLCKLLVNAMLPAIPEKVKLGLQWSNRTAQERLLCKEEWEQLRFRSYQEFKELPEEILADLRNRFPREKSEESSGELHPLN